MKNDLELARAFARAMNPPDPVSIHDVRAYMQSHPGTSNRDRLRTARSFGAVSERFGEAVIVAAATSVTRGACRWCLARAHASVHRQASPKVTAATRLLLGDPCEKDRAAIRSQLAGRLAATRASGRTFLIERKAAEQAKTDARVSELTALWTDVRDELAQLRPGMVAAAEAKGPSRVSPEVLASLTGKPIPSEGRSGWKRR